jgi:hypothetical protein
MVGPGLAAFRIVPPSPHGPLGFGVTVWLLAKALPIIRALGYGRYLPDDPRSPRPTPLFTNK